MIPGRISFVIPCYNAVRYLDDAIDSIRAQTYRNWEIVAVNDGSLDATLALLQRHAARDARIHIGDQPNAGPSAARNAGVRLAQGEFVCFLDADDVIFPEKSQKQIQYLNDHPEAGLVYSDWYTGDDQLNWTALDAVRIRQADMTEAFALRNWFPPAVPLLRRSLVDAVGGFDESLRMAEDWDYWIRCSKAGRFGYAPGAVAVYRMHGGQSHLAERRMYLGAKRALKKNFSGNVPLCHRALASFCERHARTSWNSGRRLETAALLGEAAFHRSVASMAARLGMGGNGNSSGHLPSSQAPRREADRPIARMGVTLRAPARASASGVPEPDEKIDARGIAAP